jgi:hypothetical protein
MNVAIASVKTHDKKSIYIKYERGYSLRMLIEKIYIPNFMTRGLQIDSEEKGRLGARRTAIPAHFLMGRIAQVQNVPRIRDILALEVL